MIELIFTIIVWISVYAFEANHDLNYKTIDGSEKNWDMAMFAVLHTSFALMIWYYTAFTNGLLLGIISVMIRVVFHDGFINLFRGREWCGKFTVDNKNDWWDAIMVWFYNKHIKPCYITISMLIASVVAYLWYIRLIAEIFN